MLSNKGSNLFLYLNIVPLIIHIAGDYGSQLCIRDRFTQDFAKMVRVQRILIADKNQTGR